MRNRKCFYFLVVSIQTHIERETYGNYFFVRLCTNCVVHREHMYLLTIYIQYIRCSYSKSGWIAHGGENVLPSLRL